MPLVGHGRQVLDLLPSDQGQHAAEQARVEDGRGGGGLALFGQPERTHACLFEQLQHRRVVDVVEGVEVAPPKVDGDVEAPAGAPDGILSHA
jgi:hypothetical protein